ncbi:MAG TPA: adenylate/guanylate cyclase domain-containing protein [Spirochaetales bacterium]|nr:adenylate/guanylate cyclase domain-containing protein [Spirochaetales bacterium]
MNTDLLVSLCSAAFWLGAAFVILFILIMRRQLLHYGSILLLSVLMIVYCGSSSFVAIVEKTAPAFWLFLMNNVQDYSGYILNLLLFCNFIIIVLLVNKSSGKEVLNGFIHSAGAILILFLSGAILVVLSHFNMVIKNTVIHWFFAFLLLYLVIRTVIIKDKSIEYWLVIFFTSSLIVIKVLMGIISLSNQILPFSIQIAEIIFINTVAVSLILLVLIELQIHSPEITALDSCIDNLTNTTKNYVSDFFLKELDVSNINELKIGDRVKKEVTIFFSDLRSFTELSEQLSPEQNFAFINSYLSRMVPLVTQNKGFIDKYLGDGIMAVFPENNGADNALKTAVEMLEKIQEYNRHRANSGYKPVSLGVGINTGNIIMGVIGTDERYEATVISDAVNLASRLQSISKAFNIGIVISESTFLQISDLVSYRYRFIGKVRVKGKSIPISVFEIFNGLPDEILEKKLKVNTVFEQGMIAYYQKAYAHAVSLFKQALEILPDDGAARFYLQASLQKILLKKQHNY